MWYDVTMQVTITVDVTRTVEASSEDEAVIVMQDLLDKELPEELVSNGMAEVDYGNVINIKGLD